MAFELLTLDELHEVLIAHHQNLFPDHDVSRESDEWKRLRVLAGAATDLHAHADQSFRDSRATDAEGEKQDDIGDTWSVDRKGATPAKGTAAGRVKGVAGSAYATTDILDHPNGFTYRPVSNGTVPAAGQVDIDIISVDTGSATKLDKGEILTWSSTPTGLEDEVKLVDDLDLDGTDSEKDGEYRTRILNRIGQPAKGGAENDWEQWALEATDAAGDDIGIKFGYAYPNRNGLGSVDVAALFAGSGATRLLTSAQRTSLLNYLNSKRPASMAARVLEVLTETQDLHIVITPTSDPQFAKDWNDSTPLTVNAYTSATRLLQFTTARPDSMAAGHRLIVAGYTGEELVIESLSGADSVIIETETYTPAATDTVYSGGPLIAPLRAAAQAEFDALGPRVGAFGRGNWIGKIYLGNLFELIQLTTGVLNTTITTPSADVDPTAQPFPDDDKVNLLIAGEILFRYA